MRFLEENEIIQWMGENSFEMDSRNIPDFSALLTQGRIVFGSAGRSGKERKAAIDCVTAIAPWTECLLWVREWGIWDSSEDWPAYYSARGSKGEKRSLQKSPGHLFSSSENAAAIEFLTLVMENGWEASMMCVRPNTQAALKLSHDGWVEIHSTNRITL